MFVAPLAYKVKCPNCGCEIRFSNLVNTDILAIRPRSARCANCHHEVIFNKLGFTVFAWSLYTFVATIIIYLVATFLFTTEIQNYFAIPPTIAILVSLISLRFTKLEEVRKD